MNPQTRLRRFIGDTVGLSTAYGGSRGYTTLVRKGMVPEFPVDGMLGVVARLVGSMRWAGAASDVMREVGGGLVDGAAGRLGAFHALGLKKNEAGEFVLEPPADE